MKNCLFVLMLIVILVSMTACQTPIPCEISVESRHDLKSIVLDKNLEGKIAGSFFLVSGYLKAEHTFSFYEVTESGASHLRQILAESALVFEDVTTDPWVEKKNSVDLDCSPEEIRDTEICNVISPGGCYWYEIHIPANSIVQLVDVNIDS